METKHIARPFELKALADDGSFSGYGSVFGNVDSYADIVAPGAFKKTLRDHKKQGTMPALLWQHRPDSPIGVYTGMKEDQHGLFVEGQLAVKTPLGATAYELLKMKAINGLSIGYVSNPSMTEIDAKKGTRTLKEVDLWEVSLVTFPANDAARVEAVKSLAAIEGIKSFSDAEDFLREACGLSRQEATAFVSRFKKAMNLSESGDGEMQLKQELLESARKMAGIFAPKS